MRFIRDNGGMLAVLAVVAVLLGTYAEWRIAVNVKSQLDATGQVAPHQIIAIEKDIADQKETHNRDSERMDNKIERIVDILLE